MSVCIPLWSPQSHVPKRKQYAALLQGTTQSLESRNIPQWRSVLDLFWNVNGSDRSTDPILVISFLPSDACATPMHSADYAMARCLHVHSSVTRRYCIDTAEGTIKQASHFGMPILSSNSCTVVLRIPKVDNPQC